MANLKTSNVHTMGGRGVCHARAVYRNFAEGGGNLGYGQKRGGVPGGSSMVSCEVLHSRGGGKNDTRGGKCPPPPPKYGHACHTICP